MLRTDDDTDWPDALDRRYTRTGAQFKPVRVHVGFDRIDGGRIALGKLDIYGPRINKTGLGMIVDDTFYHDPLMPWTNKIISEALAQIVKADERKAA